MYEFILKIQGREYEAKADYTRHRGSYGAREPGTGLQLEPDESDYIELDAVFIMQGDKWNEIVLPDEVYEDISIEIGASYEP